MSESEEQSADLKKTKLATALEAIRVLHDGGFRGVILSDHVPQIEVDDPWDSHVTGDATPFPKGRPQARAYSAGYPNGLLKSVGR